MKKQIYVALFLALMVLPTHATTIENGKDGDISTASTSEPLVVNAGGTLVLDSMTTNFTPNVTLSGTGNGMKDGSPRGAIYSAASLSVGFTGDVTISDATSVMIVSPGNRIRFFGNVSGNDLTLNSPNGGENACLVFNPASGKVVQLNSGTVHGGKFYFSANTTYGFAEGITLNNGGFLENASSLVLRTNASDANSPLAPIIMNTGSQLDMKNTGNISADVCLNGAVQFRDAVMANVTITWNAGRFYGAGSLENTKNRNLLFSSGVEVAADMINAASATFTFNSGSLLGADVNNTVGTLNVQGFTVVGDSTITGTITSLTGVNTINAGKTLTLDGSITDATGGTLSIANGGTLALKNCTATVNTIELSGALTLDKTDAVAVQDLKLVNTSSLVVDWSGVTEDTQVFNDGKGKTLTLTPTGAVMSEALAFYFGTPTTMGNVTTFHANSAVLPEPAAWLLLLLVLPFLRKRVHA